MVEYSLVSFRLDIYTRVVGEFLPELPSWPVDISHELTTPIVTWLVCPFLRET